ncbi:MAG: MarR family winged helix-turn-helix transcriptional regulator [Parcubacteria group bacterium]
MNDVSQSFSRRLLPEDYQALGAFRDALRRFLRFSEAGAEALGLTPQQHQAMLVIHAHPGEEPISVGQLAERLMIKNHSAVGLVARLQERGLVTRETSAEDRRRVLLKLTPKAQEQLELISRNNLRELKSNATVFNDLLATLQRIEERR